MNGLSKKCKKFKSKKHAERLHTLRVSLCIRIQYMLTVILPTP